MTTDHIRRDWTEAELDLALAQLNAGAPDPAALDRVHAAVFDPPRTVHGSMTGSNGSARRTLDATRPPRLSTRPRRRRHRLRVGVAAVLVAAAGLALLLLPSFRSPDAGSGSASAAAADSLRRAASAAITSVDEPVGPGRYRLIDRRAWSLFRAGALPDAALFESRYRVWVPSDPWDPASEWLLQRNQTGEHTWLVGDDEQGTANGYLAGAMSGNPMSETIRAACGDFYNSGGCGRTGNWADPTPEFLAALPRDPSSLFSRMAQDAHLDKGRTLGPEIFSIARDALVSGLYPADLRAAIYRTLSLVTDLDVTTQTANLDGVVGVGLGIVVDGLRYELIIDPDTGVFIGERQIALDESYGVPAGSTIGFTAVSTAVVDSAGAEPPR